MQAFTTIFDKNYLYQGVALYNSLVRLTDNFTLYTLCMDSIAYETMLKLKSSRLIPISVDELITPDVTSVRNNTTHGQFCWVCQPLICQFILDKFDVDMVTYLEADSLFFCDPKVLFDELGDKSVSLVPHNYSPGFDHTKISGKFCVQFNAFKKNKMAREVLEYWRLCCFKYSKDFPRAVPGQMSLNDWPERFDCVKIISHPGAGVAPWNIQHVNWELQGTVPYVDKSPVVFFHYHQYGRYENGDHELGHYPLTKQVIDYFYKKYVLEIKKAEALVHSVDPTFAYRRQYKNNMTLIELFRPTSIQNIANYLRVIKWKVLGRYNVLPDKYFSLNTETGKQ